MSALTLEEERAMLAEVRRTAVHVSKDEYERIAQDRLGVAQFDQMKAAFVDAERLLLSHKPPHLTNHEKVVSNELGVMLQAGLMRCLAAHRCDHAAAGARPLLAFLAARVVTCDECFLQFVSEMFMQDSRVASGADTICDFCLETPPDNYFIPVAVNFGPCRVFGDMCSACKERIDKDKRVAS